MTSRTSPIACSLTDAELRERRTGILASIASRVLERRELPDGFAYRFDADDQILHDLTELIGLERECCRFLRFRLHVEPAGGPIWLELSGPEGTQEFLAEFLVYDGSVRLSYEVRSCGREVPQDAGRGSRSSR